MKAKRVKEIEKIRGLHKVIILCAVMPFVIAGCGKATDSEKENVAQEISDIENEKSGAGQALSDMLKVDEEKWIENFEVPGGHLKIIKIGATVKVPDVTGMSMLALERQEFDAAGKRVILEAICTEGEIHSFDDDMMPKSYYEEQIATLKKFNESYLDAKERGDYSWGSEDEQLLKENQQQLDSLQKSYEKALEEESNAVGVGDYSANNYTGMTDTGSVTIYFHPEENSVNWDIGKRSEFTHKEGLDSDSEFILLAEKTDYGNLCKMSEEEAKSYAVSFAAKLGYDKYVASDVKYLTWQEGWEEWTDGYEITLAREINGMPVDYTSLGRRYQEDSYVCMGEYIRLQFNDAGIICGEIYHPRKVKEVITENTLVLSYKQVKDVMKSVLTEWAKYYSEEVDSLTEDSLSFSDMELIYYPLENEKQEIVIIPVWRLSFLESDAAGNNSAMYPLLINAIDGSWIDIWGWEEMEKIAN